MLNFVYAYSITYYIHLCTLVMRDFEMLKCYLAVCVLSVRVRV